MDPSNIATGRDGSLFAADVEANTDAIHAAYSGRRVLVVGGAGSIGSATLRALLPYQPAAVHVIDQNENGLAELVRDLRGTGAIDRRLELKLMPLDYGAPVSRRFISSAGRYDVVLHFAALKHVRSEKDVASILQMLDTNVLKQRRLMSWLADIGAPDRYFAVSTDKAANPANFMGASKRLMERLLFAEGNNPIATAQRTSARFANVAFSAGSLLASFSQRIERRQPVVAPRDTRRFFVSVTEAAQICLLASSVVPSGHVAIPRMQPEQDLRELVSIAEDFLRASGLRAIPYDDEARARAAVELDATHDGWPLLVTPRDTEGEKESEVFVADGETAKEIGLLALLSIAQDPGDAVALDRVLCELERLAGDESDISKPQLASLLRIAVPDFAPVQAGRRLDERM